MKEAGNESFLFIKLNYEEEMKMKKIFGKFLAGVTTVTLVATLVIGADVTKSVKADEPAPVEVQKWTFTQGGQFVKPNPVELWNVAYIDSVKMYNVDGTEETIGGWLKGNDVGDAKDDPSVQQSKTSQKAATGFDLKIDRNSQDKDWTNDRINPWAIRATMNDIPAEPGHEYTISFTANATKKKYCYVNFGCDVEGTSPYADAGINEGSDNQIIAIMPGEKTYTYKITNFVSASKLSVELQLGAFNSFYDFEGNDISSIVTSLETMWEGTVFVKDFTIVDNGADERFVEKPTAWVDPEQTTGSSEKPTAKPQPQTTANTTKTFPKVTGVKAKNNKKGKVTVSWKKVTGAKKYQIKVGKKTYTSKAGAKKYVVKKGLKKGKTYKIKVRALAANGYKAGKFSKTVKVKIKK